MEEQSQNNGWLKMVRVECRKYKTGAQKKRCTKWRSKTRIGSKVVSINRRNLRRSKVHYVMKRYGIGGDNQQNICLQNQDKSGVMQKTAISQTD